MELPVVDLLRVLEDGLAHGLVAAGQLLEQELPILLLLGREVALNLGVQARRHSGGVLGEDGPPGLDRGDRLLQLLDLVLVRLLHGLAWRSGLLGLWLVALEAA